MDLNSILILHNKVLVGINFTKNKNMTTQFYYCPLSSKPFNTFPLRPTILRLNLFELIVEFKNSFENLSIELLYYVIISNRQAVMYRRLKNKTKVKNYEVKIFCLLVLTADFNKTFKNLILVIKISLL